MSQQVKLIAESDRFKQLHAAGWSMPKLARHYGVSRGTISLCVEFAGLRASNKNDDAPTPEEEEASRNSLGLAPMVAAAAAEYWRKHLEDRRNESEAATSSRVCSWHNSQEERTVKVYLSNGTRLA